MKKAAIYMRVSTDRQAQEGDSIPAQRDALTRYVRDHGYLFAGEYLDDGISGTKNDRDEFQRMLADVKEGKINLILVTKMDRLHRSLRNFLNMQDILDKNHCDWLAIWEPMYDSSTPQGRMVINTMMNLAQFEAEQTGQRIRQVFAYKVEHGDAINGNPPFGYSIKDKKLVPNEDAETVRAIFKHYIQCGSIYKTVQYAADLGCVRGQTAIHEILRNRKYIGEYRQNKNYCESIVDATTFAEVQRLLGMNVKNNALKRTYIFSGLIHCGECGAPLSGCTMRKSKYYKCHHKYIQTSIKEKCVNGKTPSEKTIEDYLTKNIKDLIRGHMRKLEELEARPKDTAGRIEALNKKISRLKDLYINELISLDEYRGDKDRYQLQIEELMEEDQATSPADLTALRAALDTDFAGTYPTWDDEQKRFFWRSFIREIRFSADKSIEVIFL